MGAAVSPYRFVSAAPSWSLSVPLLQRGVPPTGCRPSRTGPAWASHRLQLFKSCSNMGPYHGVHPSGANCSSTGPPRVAAPTGSPAPAWAPLHGLQLRPGACSCGGSPWAAASFRPHPPAPPWAPPWAAAWRSAPCGTPWAAGGQPAPPWSSPQAAGELLLRRLEHLLPSFFTDLGVCRAVPHSSLSQLLLRSSFFPFLNLLSQRRKQHRSLVQVWPAAGPFWSRLELALI